MSAPGMSAFFSAIGANSGGIEERCPSRNPLILTPRPLRGTVIGTVSYENYHPMRPVRADPKNAWTIRSILRYDWIAPHALPPIAPVRFAMCRPAGRARLLPMFAGKTLRHGITAL